jgi:hypothetical protein
MQKQGKQILKLTIENKSWHKIKNDNGLSVAGLTSVAMAHSLLATVDTSHQWHVTQPEWPMDAVSHHPWCLTYSPAGVTVCVIQTTLSGSWMKS